MPQVVDQLIVTLELDATKFKEGITQVKGLLKELSDVVKGADKASQAFGKAMQAATDEVRKGVEPMTEQNNQLEKTAKGAGAAAFGLYRLVGMVNQLNRAIGFGAMRRMAGEAGESAFGTLASARRMGMDVRSLQAWEQLAGMWGGSPQEMRTDIRKVMERMGALGTKIRGGKMAEEALRVAGISVEDVRKRDVDTILTKIATAFGGGKIDDQRVEAISKALGLSESLRNILKESKGILAPTLDGLRAQANTEQEVIANMKTMVEMRRLDQEFDMAKMSVFTALAPQIREVVGWLRQFADWARDNPEKVAAGLKTISTAVSALAIALNALVIGAGFKALTSILGMGGASSAGVAAAIPGVGQAIALAGATYGLKKGVDYASGWIVDQMLGPQQPAVSIGSVTVTAPSANPDDLAKGFVQGVNTEMRKTSLTSLNSMAYR